ncbi:MAG: nucleotide-binding protein [Terracidiphilus sp.]|jgi:predicted nucleotide-binding protein
MKEEIEAFLVRIPDLHQLSRREQVEFFGFFLTEIMKDPFVRPIRVRECFDIALIPAPGNISDVIAKSRSFVTTRSGLQLRRNARERIIRATGLLPEGQIPAPAVAVTVPSGSSDPSLSPDPTPAADSVPGISKNVMVVYGRDQALRDDLFNFLRALKLNPIEWSEAIKATGKASPYVGEILDAAFKMAQAVVVLLSPDEFVQLRVELCSDGEDLAREQGFQPRANVLIEAGMALATKEERTLIVKVGNVKIPSDIQGRHVIEMDGSPEQRNELAQRLKTAGCEPETGNRDWYRIGKFDRRDVRIRKKRGDR